MTERYFALLAGAGWGVVLQSTEESTGSVSSQTAEIERASGCSQLRLVSLVKFDPAVGNLIPRPPGDCDSEIASTPGRRLVESWTSRESRTLDHLACHAPSPESCLKPAPRCCDEIVCANKEVQGLSEA